jgi:RHS repeat-associated protein
VGCAGRKKKKEVPLATSNPSSGKFCNINDSIAGQIRLTYDSLDRLTQETNSNGIVNYAYNDAGLRTNMSIVGQSAVTYRYDNANRLTNVVQATDNVKLFYDDAGRRTNLTLPNGIKVAYRYDNASRLTNITYYAVVTNKIDYSYDSTGNRVAQASPLAVYNLPAAVASATYNAANQQLTFGSYSILYDAAGNVTNIVSGTTTNRLLWSSRNQLTNMLGAVTASFIYDGLGRRRQRVVSGTTENYLYDGLDIILQKTAAGAVGARYLRGLAIDEPWQRTDIGAANTNRIYLADALGSIVGLADTNKVIQTEYDYEPFGTTTTTGSANKNAYKFTAREEDGTGLYYYRARYYHPVLGRFVGEDPIDLVVLANRYLYAGDDPVNYFDPLGLWQFTATFAPTVLGWSAQVTFGKNSGQWNVGVKAGVGEGISAHFNPFDTGCKEQGVSVETQLSGRAGLGAGVSVGTGASDREGWKTDVHGGIPGFKHLDFGAEIVPFDVQNPIRPYTEVTAGQSGFLGGGVRYYGKGCECP